MLCRRDGRKGWRRWAGGLAVYWPPCFRYIKSNRMAASPARLGAWMSPAANAHAANWIFPDYLGSTPLGNRRGFLAFSGTTLWGKSLT